MKSVLLGVSLENFRLGECCCVAGGRLFRLGKVQCSNRVKWEQLYKSYNVSRLKLWETKAAHLIGVHNFNEEVHKLMEKSAVREGPCS